MALSKDQAERIRELDAQATKLQAEAEAHAATRSQAEQAKWKCEKDVQAIREKILAIYRESDKSFNGKPAA